jgi:flagellar biosynthesis regulator FlaF
LSSDIFFDADGDTIKTNTAWVKPTDGLLVFDRNNNGIIDNGGELFGDQTVMKDGKKAAHGFMALKELDTNQDGIFDNKDALYNTVKVWQDLNQDGISQTNELSGLNNANVASININSQSVSQSWNREQYTNAILVEGSTFTRTDGITDKAGSFIFAQNYASQQFTPIIISQAAANLPDIKGSGFIRDLKEAATIDTHLMSI